jgi:hypothetical protein
MAVWLALMVVPWLALCWLVVGLVRVGGRGPQPVVAPAALSGQVNDLRRGANRRVWFAAAVGAPFAVLVLMLALAAELGLQAVALAALAAGGAACLSVALVGPPPTAAVPVRTAELTPRSWRGFGPRWAFPIPGGLAALLVVLVAGAAVVASTPPSGSGTGLAWTATAGLSGYVQPWPGTPLALVLLATLGLAGGSYVLALHRVAGWPRPTEPALFDLDDEVRRAGTRMLLFTASGALLIALGAICSVCIRAWDTITTTMRMNGATPEGDLDRALGVSSVAASVTILAGLTFMLLALVAGWVRTPQPAVEPAAHR